MLDKIQKYHHSRDQDYTFSILIPTWNNLGYLKNCLEGINDHSSHSHQVIVFVNDGADGTIEWLREQSLENMDFIHSPANIGICHAMNICRTMTKADFLVFLNDDMYVLPGWDEELIRKIKGLDTKMFMLSSTMIEPRATGNNCVVVKNYGSDLASFRMEDLVKEFRDMKSADWQGATWPPNVLHVDTWDLVGGFSTEFTPGMYSDPDLSFKLLQAGVRHFIGVGSSLVYHFGCKSTQRIRKSRGHRIFLSKWGISSRTFRTKFLKMGEPYSGPLPEPDPGIYRRPLHRMKRLLNRW
jgi:glycosyltransferase involved in cell wall biosynthesis